MASLKVGILISGRGSNMRALIEACAAADFPAEVVLVISNRADAAGLALAEAAGVPSRVIDHRDYDDRESFDTAMTEALREAGAGLVCLAGFMRLLSGEFCQHWRDRLINIHPSLLPAFKGLHVQERMLEAGVRIGGCTVHFIRPEMDTGPIIVQAAVPLAADDTADSLAARILEQEHRIYPLALRLIAEGRVRIVGERVLIDGLALPAERLLNPPPV
ncbi:MAG: phosphoribosylglycinamide formyltransferase [Alphaproteobacteria bacterium]|jgi:phosphoribosylglycinamide formyltransferase-1|nr:phosphoribosylglycinamide formyltransferase [Alphaproteobacteria bacterium]MDP6815138.1 phosphoribosylglycinamide formyltransferase [Alphaproteobacteria bacterium]